MKGTLSPPMSLRLYTLPYWSNPPVLICNILAPWRSGLSTRVPECHKSKLAGLTSMALNASNSNNLEQLALKGLMEWQIFRDCSWIANERRIRLRHLVKATKYLILHVDTSLRLRYISAPVPCVWQRVWLRHSSHRACDTEQRLLGTRTGRETDECSWWNSFSNCVASSVQTMLLAAACRGCGLVRALCDKNWRSTLNLYATTINGGGLAALYNAVQSTVPMQLSWV